MTYNTHEVSNEDGRPISLYRFILGTKDWFYTSADRDIVYGGDTYLAVAIQDEGIDQGGGAEASNDLKISAQADLEPLSLYIGTPPSIPMQVIVRRLHQGDL